MVRARGGGARECELFPGARESVPSPRRASVNLPVNCTVREIKTA